MKIIQKGNLHSSAIRFECRVCRCVFEAEKTLEARRVSDQRDGDYYECGCPTCSNVCTKQA